MSDDNTKKYFEDLTKIRPNGGARPAGVEEVLSVIPVRKPKRLEFVRTSPEMWQETTVFVDETDRNEVYYVPPEMRDALRGVTKDVQLVPTITAQRVLMLWPLNMPADDGRTNYWTETSRQAAAMAKTVWVRVGSDMSLGAYRIHQAEGATTLEPQWPTLPLNDLLAIAFKGRIIDTPEHAIVRRLANPT